MGKRQGSFIEKNKEVVILVGLLALALFAGSYGRGPFSAVGGFDSAFMMLGNPIGPNPQWPDNVIQATSECCGDIEGGGRKAVLWDLGAVWQFSQPHIGVDWVKQYFDSPTTLYFQTSEDGRTWKTLWTDTITAQEPIGTRHRVGKAWLDFYDLRARFVRIYADNGGVLDAQNTYLPVEGPPYHIDQPPLPLPKTIHQPGMWRIMGKQYTLAGAPGLLYGQQFTATDTTGNITIDKGSRTWAAGPLNIVPTGQEGGYPVNSASQSLMDLYNAQSIDPDTKQASEYPKPPAQQILWEDAKWTATHGGAWTLEMEALTGMTLGQVQNTIQSGANIAEVEANWNKLFGSTYGQFLALHPEKAPAIGAPAQTTPPQTPAPTTSTPPPKPVPRGIGSFVTDFLEVVKRLISDILPFSIVGPAQVTPGQMATYTLEIEAPLPDHNFADGTYTTEYGYWALVDASGNILQKGAPVEVSTAVYRDTATIIVPSNARAFAIVGIVTKVDARLVNGLWVNGDEVLVSKEAVSVENKVVAEGPPPRPVPKGLGAFLSSFWDALMKFLASFRKV